MPTFSQYLAGSDRVRFARDLFVHESSVLDVSSSERASLTGPVGLRFDAELTTARRHLAEALHELGRLIALCDERARVCRAHAEQVWGWEQLDPFEQIRTPRPQPPAPWVDA